MVKSGLGQDIIEDKKHPRVSPYRLCAHLSSAFVIFTGMLWSGLDIISDRKNTKRLDISFLSAKELSILKMFKRKSWFTAALVGITVMSGAFVAGNDAGFSYNTWPLMADRWIPTDIISEYLPLWRNPFENSAMVQFNHRNLVCLLTCRSQFFNNFQRHT